MAKEELKFYDVRARKSFFTNKYKKVSRMVKGNKRMFAVAKAPSGVESWRVLPKKK